MRHSSPVVLFNLLMPYKGVVVLSIQDTCTALQCKPALWRHGRVFASHAEGCGFDRQLEQKVIRIFSPVKFGAQHK